ncbi:hypothetical protein HYH02_003635 [Chlamydomonas schloesseri]|uniref:Pherophorin domain-containing protein n=1 Tax=Chlamydomonas schloesseri TaxID=2026947 RepID=A0A835WPV4_9CHLO|nr:hypothetical protein HYH02_003635 [Chlamydomonas schloesseri]|eukprot:KAG2451859.1 hypothetical protein HYH02_003635 [Chlamydomonas schloesseri]
MRHNSRLRALAAVLLLAACNTARTAGTQQTLDDYDYVVGDQGYEYSTVDKTYTEADFAHDGAELSASPAPVVENRDAFVSRSQFPYCRCGRGTYNNPYRLELSRVTQLSNGASSRACYRIVRARTCDGLDPSSRTGMCCSEVERQLHKLHVEADPRCRGSVRSVSLNGWSGKAWQWEDSLGPSAALKISNLGLNSTQAVATEVCFTLSGPCATIQDLCYNEPSCRYALFSAAGVNADGGYCCMIGDLAINGTSSGGTAYNSAQARPLPLLSGDCADLTSFIAGGIDDILYMGYVVTQPFEALVCSPTLLKVCGVLEQDGSGGAGRRRRGLRAVDMVQGAAGDALREELQRQTPHYPFR